MSSSDFVRHPGQTYDSVTSEVLFYPMGDDDIKLASCVSITSTAGTKGNMPMASGINDARMGTTDHAWDCQTCFNKKTVCPGHYGSVQLRYPLKSPMFREELLKWLKIVCHHCGELGVDLKVQVKHRTRLAEIVKLTRSGKPCPHCNAPYMTVSRELIAPLTFYRSHAKADGTVVQTEFYNHQIRDVLQRISTATLHLVGRHEFAHPSNFIISVIRALPNTCRPDQRRIGGTRNNRPDTTSLLKTIVDMNMMLPNVIPQAHLITEALKADYTTLEMTYTNMIRGGSTGEVSLVSNTGKPLMSLAEGIKSKKGRIRSNLMGKRVSYMIRSVITGDPHLRINQVGIPLKHVRNLEIPITLSEANREEVMGYYLNGRDVYPGCSQIIMKSTGATYRVEHINEDYVPQIGDVIFRDIIDGDVVNLNRQPSLLFSNVACMTVRVMTVGDTIRINPSVCNYFNADFDGDQMNAIVFQSIMSRVESSMISTVARYFISPQTQAPLVGCFQDGLIGISEFTRHGLELDALHAMRLFGDITTRGLDYDFTNRIYTNYELVSRLLPKINMVGRRPKMYVKSYKAMLNYTPEDIMVNIIRGELKSGVLDYSTVGQGVRNSIFHIIANKFGSDLALECVYNLQQLTHRYFLQQSFTVGISDVYVSPNATREIKRNLGMMVAESHRITDILNRGDLVAPLGVSLKDHFEAEQINALSAGDTFSHPVLSDIDLDNNGLARLIFSKSKGNVGNLVAIFAAVGHQLIDGRINTLRVGHGRSSIYFPRYCTEPASLGFIDTSFVEGVNSESYPFMAAEARYGITCNALKTAETGYRNRINIKCAESAVINNLRQLTKGASILQILYANCGLDPARCELVLFPTVMISDAEFEEKWHTSTRQNAGVPKAFQNADVQALLDEEFEQIRKDRDEYRRIHGLLQAHDPREYMLRAKKQMPVNVLQIISDTVFNFEGKTNSLDPVACIAKVRALCDGLGYVFSNSICRAKQTRLPHYIVKATEMMQILLRSYLCTSFLIREGVTNETLQIILDTVIDMYSRALIDYGSAAGVLAAQCLSEPLTQFVLNSKHRSGQAGAAKTNGITRVSEIFGGNYTDKMENPSMIVALKPEFQNSELKANEVANNIEMMQLKSFVKSIHIFFEEYGKILHPLFQCDRAVIEQIEKHNLGQSRPTDLTKWCIRFGINRDELVMKSIEIETIIFAIRRALPELYLIYTPGNAEDVFIRCYIRGSMIKSKKRLKTNYYDDIVMPLMERIKLVIVRGVDGVISAQVIHVSRMVRGDDGSIASQKVCYIATAGSNLRGIANNPNVDKYLTMTDSIREIEAMFGIAAARAKIENELVNTLHVSPMQASVFADDMVWSGEIVNVNASGMQAREPDGIFVRASFQKPMHIFTDAAIRGVVDRMQGLSAALMIGASPKIGTHYNHLIVNEAFIADVATQFDSAIEDL